MKKKIRQKSSSAKQKDLLTLAKTALTAPSNVIVGIWLVRQGLRQRSEQFMALAANKKQGVEFCRNTLTPKYCRDNEKNSMHFLVKGEKLGVNYGTDLLMIKGIDFVRTEMGRTNNNPLWYWNIAAINIVKDLIK